MGYFLNTVKGSDVVESVDRRAQSTVQTEDLVFDESSKGEVIEEVGKVFPNVGVAVFPQALVVETVDLSDLTGLVVATEDGNTLRVTNLQTDQKGYSLDGIVASVDVITCSYESSRQNGCCFFRMRVQLAARKLCPTLLLLPTDRRATTTYP